MMKTSFCVTVTIMLALYFIQVGCTTLTDNGDPNQDMVEARDETAAEFYEIPAHHWKVAYNNRQKRHADPGPCRFCCNCCGRMNFCGLCCKW
ncbi:hepcidin-like [Phycodurus eques]|uniref:hepcidin-like n=1 Tax=Phycodurus eques TaxID=693459 RepID=UPI002ACE5045|nr:hepcidin-like [Phycodurus eques]